MITFSLRSPHQLNYSASDPPPPLRLVFHLPPMPSLGRSTPLTFASSPAPPPLSTSTPHPMTRIIFRLGSGPSVETYAPSGISNAPTPKSYRPPQKSPSRPSSNTYESRNRPQKSKRPSKASNWTLNAGPRELIVRIPRSVIMAESKKFRKRMQMRGRLFTFISSLTPIRDSKGSEELSRPQTRQWEQVCLKKTNSSR